MTKQKQLLLVPAVIATGMMSFAGVLIETAMNVTFPTLIRQFDLTTAKDIRSEEHTSELQSR